MCLYVKTDNKVSKIAEEDKTVYKVFACFESSFGELLLTSPYRQFPYFKKENVAKNFEYAIPGNTVLVGFHSFENIDEANVLKENFAKREYEFNKDSRIFAHFIVLACVIPKGAAYYVGEFPHTAYIKQPICICSDKIIVKDQKVILDNNKIYEIKLD